MYSKRGEEDCGTQFLCYVSLLSSPFSFDESCEYNQWLILCFSSSSWSFLRMQSHYVSWLSFDSKMIVSINREHRPIPSFVLLLCWFWEFFCNYHIIAVESFSFMQETILIWMFISLDMLNQLITCKLIITKEEWFIMR